jgi:hypothetical protein
MFLLFVAFITTRFGIAWGWFALRSLFSYNLVGGTVIPKSGLVGQGLGDWVTGCKFVNGLFTGMYSGKTRSGNGVLQLDS